MMTIPDFVQGHEARANARQMAQTWKRKWDRTHNWLYVEKLRPFIDVEPDHRPEDDEPTYSNHHE